MDQEEYDEIVRTLVRIAAQQSEFNSQQVEINTDTKTTLARIETLLARMLRTEDNGR
jgi:hypothetical protein